MFVKTTARKTKSGTVRYLQLAHNEWDPAAGRSARRSSTASAGTDQLDRAAIERLVGSLSRLLDPADGARATRAGAELSVLRARARSGGTVVLDGLWRRLGIDTVLHGLDAAGASRAAVGSRPVTERVLFGLVANRALAPSSKLAAADWITHDVHIDGLPETSDDACYRAMDWLHDVREQLERGVFRQVANLLNLEVDLLFFDTTSTYFELEDPDEPVARDEHGHPLPDNSATPGRRQGRRQGRRRGRRRANRVGFRTYGKSKDSRDDLPQIVIGMAVTRDGIPVRVWCWPGNTNDSALIRQVKDDMRDWTLSKIVWVADRGFSSEHNRRYLRQGDHAYIIGEKLRSDSPEIKAALSRQGRYTDDRRQHAGQGSEGVRHRAVRDLPQPRRRRRATPHIREQLVAQLEELIAGSDSLPVMKRGELRGKISTKPGLNRYLRVTPGGLLRIDKAKIKTEANLDGKYLLRCSDPHLLGRRHRAGLQAAPRGRTRLAGHEADPRPAPGLSPPRRTHPRPRRALLARAAAHPHHRDHAPARPGTTCAVDLDRLHAGTFTGPTGMFRQRTEPHQAPDATSTPGSTSPPRSRSSSSPPQAADQRPLAHPNYAERRSMWMGFSIRARAVAVNRCWPGNPQAKTARQKPAAQPGRMLYRQPGRTGRAASDGRAGGNQKGRGLVTIEGEPGAILLHGSAATPFAWSCTASRRTSRRWRRRRAVRRPPARQLVELRLTGPASCCSVGGRHGEGRGAGTPQGVHPRRGCRLGGGGVRRGTGHPRRRTSGGSDAPCHVVAHTTDSDARPGHVGGPHGHDEHGYRGWSSGAHVDQASLLLRRHVTCPADAHDDRGSRSGRADDHDDRGSRWATPTTTGRAGSSSTGRRTTTSTSRKTTSTHDRQGTPLDIEAFDVVGGPPDAFDAAIEFRCGSKAGSSSCLVPKKVYNEGADKSSEDCKVTKLVFTPKAEQGRLHRGTKATATISCPRLSDDEEETDEQSDGSPGATSGSSDPGTRDDVRRRAEAGRRRGTGHSGPRRPARTRAPFRSAASRSFDRCSGTRYIRSDRLAGTTRQRSPARCRGGATRVFKIVGAIVAPTTLLTGLMFYFGRLHITGMFRYLGVNFTVLDLTFQDYLIRSADGLFVPLAVAAG